LRQTCHAYFPASLKLQPYYKQSLTFILKLLTTILCTYMYICTGACSAWFLFKKQLKSSFEICSKNFRCKHWLSKVLVCQKVFSSNKFASKLKLGKLSKNEERKKTFSKYNFMLQNLVNTFSQINYESKTYHTSTTRACRSMVVDVKFILQCKYVYVHMYAYYIGGLLLIFQFFGQFL
jgi:hypothetical protein